MTIRPLFMCVGVIFALQVAGRVEAQPVCTGDSWGFGGAGIQRTVDAGVHINATARLNHTSAHASTCFGDLGAKGWLYPASVGAPSITSCDEAHNQWRSLQVSYSSSHTNALFENDCVAVRGHSYRTNAMQRWNFNEPDPDFGYFDSESVYIPRDADNDGIEEDLDCNDTIWDPSNTCSSEPPCGSECGGDPECEECECSGRDWLYWDGIYTCESPILINMSSNTAQYHLTSANDGVMFDMNGDGVKHRISWTAAESIVAFLAMDRNGNGQVDDGTELFGNHTRKRDGTRAKHGFEALADLDDPVHKDGAITPADSIYSRLLLWTDSNHNGISEPSELSSVADAGIISIDTTYLTRRRRDQFGNRYRFEGDAVIVEGNQTRQRRIFDVFFVRYQ